MGVRFPSVQAFTANFGQVTGTGEGIIQTVGPLIPPLDSAQILVLWSYSGTQGSTGTTITARIRRGTTTGGTLLNTGLLQPVGNNVIFSLSGGFVDTIQGLTGVSYVLSSQTNSGGTQHNCNDVFLAAFVL